MKVKCNTLSFTSLGKALVSVKEGWEDFELCADVKYNVYGVGLYSGSLKILIDPANNLWPSWYSADHFVVVDNEISQFWKISLDDGDWNMIIGYPELVSSVKHFDGLLERDTKELEVFRLAVQAHCQ